MARGQEAGRIDPARVTATPEAIAALPATPGVYLFSDESGEVLYIGKSVDVRARVRSYFHAGGGHTRRTARLKHEAAEIAALPTGSELEALLLESRLIKEHLPRYNVRGRRYENYPFLKISHEPFPRLLTTRDLADDGARYFGPFPSMSSLETAVEAMQPLFGLRTCRDLPTSACLQLGIGRCMGPCVNAVEEEYADAIASVERLLRGEADEVRAALRGRMEEASRQEAFERAARLRDRLAALERVVAHQVRLRGATGDLDVVVVLPAYPAPAVTFLAIRRARWVGQWVCSAEGLQAREARGRLVAFLREHFVQAPAPSPRVGQRELDEVSIVGAWLYRRRTAPGVFFLEPDSLAAIARRALSHARALQPKARLRHPKAAEARET